MIILLTEDAKLQHQAGEALKDHEIASFEKAEEFLAAVRENHPALVMIDFDLHETDGLTVYNKLRQIDPYLKTIMLSASQNIPLAVSAAKLGVEVFLRKPLPEGVLQAEVEKLFSKEEAGAFRVEGEVSWWLTGHSPRLADFIFKLEKATLSSQDLILVGERGIDYNGLARLVHRQSRNRTRKFIELDLTSFGKESTESSLFITLQELLLNPAVEAVREEREIPGTLYLKGISEMREDLRQNLWQFLKKRKTESRYNQKVRIILSSYKDWAEGETCESLAVPALRERKEDLPVILEALLSAFASKVNNLEPQVLKLLMYYDFPGNYEELKDLLAGLKPEERLDLSNLPINFTVFLKAELNRNLSSRLYDLMEVRREFESDLFKLVLAQARNDHTLAARALDIPKTIFMQRLQDLGLEAGA
jgi:DNA-binding NtrC family response regulator